MSRPERDERWVEMALDIGHKLNHAVKDVIPPDAQHHLLNAQRELLTALFLIYEHQAGARRPPAERPRRRSPRTAGPQARRSRVDRIEID